MQSIRSMARFVHVYFHMLIPSEMVLAMAAPNIPYLMPAPGEPTPSVPPAKPAPPPKPESIPRPGSIPDAPMAPVPSPPQSPAPEPPMPPAWG